MELVVPTEKYKESFIAAVKEFQADDDYTSRTKAYHNRISVPELEKDFKSYVEREMGFARGENLPEGYVPYSDFWLVYGGAFVGRVTVRHGLTDYLMKFGGHIGYDLRPSKRGRGYGNEILRLALQKAKGLGIARVLITVDARNTASRKIVEKNGGVLENQIPNPEAGSDFMRYWIDIK
jgi:predicted acetyltransferase